MKKVLHNLTVYMLSVFCIAGGIYIIRNFIFKLSAYNFTGWLLCFAGVMVIIAEILVTRKHKENKG